MTEHSGLRMKSTKTYVHANGLSCCFRQHRARSHCAQLHGYALQVKITFEGNLDENNWVVDFGSLKPIKAFLEDMFDHTLVVAHDDPHRHLFQQLASLNLANIRIVQSTGCEAFAKLIFDYVNAWMGDHSKNPDDIDAWVASVEVREHEANSAICERTQYYGGRR